MLWSILGLVGGGSFIVTGFGVLTDPSCDTVGFGGGRAVQVTCYEAGAVMSGEFSGSVAGFGMLAVGGLILYFAWRNFKRSK
jgi:hypothetical protein